METGSKNKRLDMKDTADADVDLETSDAATGAATTIPTLSNTTKLGPTTICVGITSKTSTITRNTQTGATATSRW